MMAAMTSQRPGPQASGGQYAGRGVAAPSAQQACVPGRSTLTSALPPDDAVLQRRTRDSRDGEDSSPDVHKVAAAGVAGASAALPHASTIQRLFGRHDISGIKAQVGGAAAPAADQLGASAYATGDKVAFGGEPDLHTAAHEAAHVVQQRAGVQLSGGIGQQGDPYERHADAVADRVVRGESAEQMLGEVHDRPGPGATGVQRKAWVAGQPLTVDAGYRKIVRTTWGDKAVKRLDELTSDQLEHRFANWNELTAEYERAQKAPAAEPAAPAAAPEDENAGCDELPGFSQRGGTCATASLLTPLLVWDKETYDPAAPNPRLRSLVQKMKAYMVQNQAMLQLRFGASVPGYQSRLRELELLDQGLQLDSFKLTAHNYQALAVLLLELSNGTPDKGLDEAGIQTARKMAGVSGETKSVATFEGFFDAKSDLTKLQPGQMAQLVWFVKPGLGSADPLAGPPKLEPHGLTLGRLDDGKWVMNDQGSKPPVCLSGPDLASLRDQMIDASESGRWAGVVDNEVHPPVPGVVTGYSILGDASTPAH
jgi:hypothetical protein